MANTPDDSRFADAFLDDFFAESEEHLAAIRRNLLALETALPEGTVPAPVLDEMFRSFHSLKGISGMVELDAAEMLAHDMESYLRALRSGDARLTAPGVEALFDGTAALESVIAARRAKADPPDIEAVRNALAAVLPAQPTPTRRPPRRTGAPVAPPALPERTPSTQPAEADARATWHVTFEPSAELLARGVNVNLVRDQLRSVGEILEARPSVTAAGGIAFEFIVASSADARVFEAWKSDGITATPRAAAAAVAPGEWHEPAPPTTTRAATSISRLVRVDLTRLDDVMRIVADLVVTRGRLDEALERAAEVVPHDALRALQESSETLERQMRDLRESVMKVRLVPVREIFSRMPFVVRDLARDNGKQVRLSLGGQDTEIDKFLIERMMDPILHLVRNAISHGIEPPAERVAQGKAAAGTIGLRAATVGEMVIIEVEDDGRGIDRARVIERARALGAELPTEVDSGRLLELLCTAGLSTRDEADRASGRGVGMTVVKQAIEQLSGSLDVQTEPGRGTRFVITLPVTLAILDAIICRVGAQRFAVPQSAVREVLAVREDTVRTLEHNELFPYRDGVLPLVRAARLLGLDETAPGGRLHVFVIGSGVQAVGLGVERIQGQREIVVRAVTDPLIRIEGVAGATELGDGRPILILDPAALLRLARRTPAGTTTL